MRKVVAENDEKVAAQVVDNEVIIINVETGTYYSLKGSGLHIWATLDALPTAEEIIDWLASQYSTSRAEIAETVNPVLSELEAEEIIVVKESDAPLGALPELSGDFQAPEFEKFTNMSDLLLLDPIHDVDEQGWPVQKGE